MKVYVDASPTRLCVVTEDGRKRILEAKSTHTSNEAEYFAVNAAILWHRDVTEICSDSPLIVKQLNGEYKVNKPELAKLRDMVLGNARGRVKFTWIPRDENPARRELG